MEQEVIVRLHQTREDIPKNGISIEPPHRVVSRPAKRASTTSALTVIEHSPQQCACDGSMKYGRQ